MSNWRDDPQLGSPLPILKTEGANVLIDLPDGARPTARLRFVDGADLFVSWVWAHQPDSPRMTIIGRELVSPVLDRLARALPTPLAGETGIDALRRALTDGVLLDADREQHLAQALTAALVPQWLGSELNALEQAGRRPHLRIQLSPSTAQLPWELLSTSGDERGIDMADVSVLLPPTLRNDPARTVSPWSPEAPVVAVLDPVVPGFATGGELGSVLGPVDAASPLAQAVQELDARRIPSGAALRRSDIGRIALAEAVADAGRLLYVGHVTASTHALDARLHLSDGADAPGTTPLIGAHRPYSAAEIALGGDALAPLRSPNRVALIACDSGTDMRFAEPTGLVAAFAHRGAEYVTATRWTLPTEAGLRRLAPQLGDRAAGMLTDAIVAVNAAHEAADPVAALGAWQREQRMLWTSTGDPRHSPIIWGALATAWTPAPAAGASIPSRN
ncbi:CHAT domain-containing protein [Microbacterium sp. SD291]|uniref:CHAT domain-containing protein n=1 Tax=Microbacterium sp. SD291 TaxID=2782007 RepID=UPI001A9738E7|nr:CHAT domain-containing protein [Microbacterium sp. SD291]MBO0981266.1 CHAT domain-containing protein [Microbacterium sp. SD291]